jgi:hypothetical protein
MAYTGTTDVPPVGQGAVDLPFRLKASESVEAYQAVTIYTSGTGTVEVQITTVANDEIAGFCQDKIVYTDFDSSHIFYVAVRVAGTTHYIAGADCSAARGDWLILEGTDGRLQVCPATAATLYTLVGWGLDNPDADGNIGTCLIVFNQKWSVPV